MKRSTEVPQKLGGGGILDLSRFILDPNRRIFFTSLTIASKPGALASVLGLLAKHEINILGIQGEAISEKEVGRFSMFIETSSPISANELESKLRDEMSREKIEVVKELRVFDHLNNFDADIIHFPLFEGGSRVVIFSASRLGGMIKSLMKELNPTAVQTIFWYEGKGLGRLVEEFYEKEFSIINMNEAVNFLAIRLTLHGWATVEIVKLDDEKRSATLRLFDNWECSTFKGSSEPQSHFIRGVLAGFFSSLFKVEIEAKETKCIAKGDPYCEFEIKEKKEAS